MVSVAGPARKNLKNCSFQYLVIGVFGVVVTVMAVLFARCVSPFDDVIVGIFRDTANIPVFIYLSAPGIGFVFLLGCLTLVRKIRESIKSIISECSHAVLLEEGGGYGR